MKAYCCDEIKVVKFANSCGKSRHSLGILTTKMGDFGGDFAVYPYIVSFRYLVYILWCIFVGSFRCDILFSIVNMCSSALPLLCILSGYSLT